MLICSSQHIDFPRSCFESRGASAGAAIAVGFAGIFADGVSVDLKLSSSTYIASLLSAAALWRFSLLVAPSVSGAGAERFFADEVGVSMVADVLSQWSAVVSEGVGGFRSWVLRRSGGGGGESVSEGEGEGE